jgi:CBS domain-containing protein
MGDQPYHDWDEHYFDRPRERHRAGFGVDLLREPLTALPAKPAVTLSVDASVTDAVRLMQREHCGCVLITDGDAPHSKLVGIFTERDVLFRIVDKGRNPAALPVGEVMTASPEVLPMQANIAYVLNKMSVGGFRHIPVVDEDHRPVLVISVRDVVHFLVDAFPREVLNLPAGAASQRAREGA